MLRPVGVQVRIADSRQAGVGHHVRHRLLFLLLLLFWADRIRQKLGSFECIGGNMPLLYTRPLDEPLLRIGISLTHLE